MAKRKRRSFTTEFKTQAVRIVRESGKPIGTVARELDLTETALRSWVRQAEIVREHRSDHRNGEGKQLGRAKRPMFHHHRPGKVTWCLDSRQLGEVHARFRRLVERAIVKADREHAAELAKIGSYRGLA